MCVCVCFEKVKVISENKFDLKDHSFSELKFGVGAVVVVVGGKSSLSLSLKHCEKSI